MLPPSKKEAEGYDVVVWVDNDGDIVARGFTHLGHKQLKGFVNSYHPGDIVQIYCEPDEFIAEFSPETTVGMLNSRTKKIGPYSASRLH